MPQADCQKDPSPRQQMRIRSKETGFLGSHCAHRVFLELLFASPGPRERDEREVQSLSSDPGLTRSIWTGRQASFSWNHCHDHVPSVLLHIPGQSSGKWFYRWGNGSPRQTPLGPWPFPVNRGPGCRSVSLVFRFEVCYESQQQDQWLIFSLFSITGRKRNTPKSMHESACELVPTQPCPGIADSHLSLVFTSVK